MVPPLLLFGYGVTIRLRPQPKDYPMEIISILVLLVLVFVGYRLLTTFINSDVAVAASAQALDLCLSDLTLAKVKANNSLVKEIRDIKVTK